MLRFIYTIVSFVILSGFGIWYIVFNTRPAGIFIILISLLFFIFLALICSLIVYFFRLRKSKIIFPYEYKGIYRSGLIISVLVSSFVTLLISFQLLQVLDLITLILLLLFFVFVGVLRSDKVR